MRYVYRALYNAATYCYQVPHATTRSNELHLNHRYTKPYVVFAATQRVVLLRGVA